MGEYLIFVFVVVVVVFANSEPRLETAVVGLSLKGYSFSINPKPKIPFTFPYVLCSSQWSPFSSSFKAINDKTLDDLQWD